MTTLSNAPIDIMKLPSGQDCFVLTTDPQGQVRFRVYPKKRATGRIDFLAKIHDLTREEYTAAICIYPNFSKNHPLDNPFINEIEEGGTLKKLPGQTDFTVSVNSYFGYMQPDPTDVIAFFTLYDGITNKDDETTPKTLLSPTYRVNNIHQIEDRVFSFSYDQLEPNKPGGIYYAVISKKQGIMYSDSLYMNYVNYYASPGSNKNRLYDKPQVYSSYIQKSVIKPSSGDGIVNESSPVNFNTISAGLNFDDGSDNKNKAGLYVVVQVSGTGTQRNLPSLNQTGQVRATIESPKGTVNKLYTLDLTTANLYTDSNTNHKFQIVTIPFCLLKGIKAIGDDQESRLYIDYVIKDATSGTEIASQVWVTDIYTYFPTGDDPSGDDEYYGCV
ncbi:hypothetical protein ID858_17065 [Xenorhabdus sp. DI]|uniref:hypothetical protein n=1 Tax=Xenorhabdus doucetiae TaxID=351671 RepID=UPI00198A4898|nr:MULTISPECIES: hypothetical protein [unclassified Xenorhabdus]MBD2786501.1 hypothetical protein [Xenorhabdus sp. 3]MBD2790204.1 hypothetical protein [Xenorhabdus sp. DI]